MPRLRSWGATPAMSGESESQTVRVPDGWVREEIIGGMDTVGTLGMADEYLGMGGGYNCDTCEHYIPTEALEDATCPSCERSGMIGTIVQGRQEITALYPEGWFDDE